MSEIINNSNLNDIKLNIHFSTISNRINTLIESFDSHDSTHPVLSILWSNTLKIYKNQLYIIEKIIEQGESLLENFPDNIIDPDISTILSISALLSTRNDLDVDVDVDVDVDIDANMNDNSQ